MSTTAVASAIASGSLTVVKNDPAIVGYIQQAAKILASAQALTIDSDATKKQATDFLVSMARLTKDAETKRTALVKPHNDFVKDINVLFRDVLDPVVRADQLLRNKVLAYDREQRRLAAEAVAAAEKARLESEALQRAAEQAEQEGKTDVAEKLLDSAIVREETAAVATVQAAATPAKTTTGTVGGVATTKLVWTYEVVNEAEIPREYFVLDERKVRDAIRTGTREIPGLRIFQAEQLSVRA